MPYHKISRDVKLAAVKLYEGGFLSLHDILDCVGFSKRTFECIHALWVATGDVVKHQFGPPIQGRPRTLNFDDVDYLVRLIQQCPDWFLDELLNLLKTNQFISVNYVTVFRTLVRAGVSLKKLKKIASERDEDRRNAFINHIAMYEPEELGFLDETSKNEKTAARSRGRARKGCRAIMKQHFVRGQRLSATGLLTIDGIVVSKVVEGSMTRDLYLNFLEHEVVCASFTSFILCNSRLRSKSCLFAVLTLVH
jgi:transposase